ncbi:MAG: hypothetical protein QF745_03540, partial [Planctomycetota bacterium]|nr:hypothetical protein [Planctomycetota bacterium]
SVEDPVRKSTNAAKVKTEMAAKVMPRGTRARSPRKPSARRRKAHCPSETKVIRKVATHPKMACTPAAKKPTWRVAELREFDIRFREVGLRRDFATVL